jgi:ApaG protein
MNMSEKNYDISVDVQPAYIAEQSDPGNNHFVFSYTVTIKNTGNIPAKLLTRHWIITDGDGETQEVKGEGVVGETPYLRPGENFEYTSGTMMRTPIGTMRGSYQMVADDGVNFEAEIPSFSLNVPKILH